jgi:hypothetical protein
MVLNFVGLLFCLRDRCSGRTRAYGRTNQVSRFLLKNIQCNMTPVLHMCATPFIECCHASIAFCKTGQCVRVGLFSVTRQFEMVRSSTT